MLKSDKVSKFTILLSFLFLTAIGITMAYLSWRKWPDILVDFGRELYVPWQLNQGAILYRDIFHLYGPLSQYFNSWLFRIFGTQFMTLALFNMGLIVILTYFIYSVFLETADSLTATAAGAIFLSVFAFSQYVGTANYNFVCPYSHEIIHGIFLSFFSIYIFMNYLKNRKSSLLAIIGIAVGLVALTKVEVFLAIFSAITAGLFIIIWTDKLTIAKISRLLGIFSLGFVLPSIGFAVYFSCHMPPAAAIGLLLLPYRALFTSSIPSNIFHKRIFGIDTPILNLNKLLITTGWYILLLVLIWLLSRIVNRIQNRGIRKIAILAIFVASASSALFIINRIPWMDIWRGLPAVLIAFAAYLFIRILYCRGDSQGAARLLSLLVMTIFGFALLLKMILNVHIFHYGFALAMPATLLFVMLLTYQIPVLYGKLSGNTNFVRALGLMLIGICILPYISLSKRIYGLKTYPVGSSPDTIMAFSPRVSDMGSVMNDALLKVKELLKKDDTFVVLPEGIMLNYLTRHKNPCPYFEFMPPLFKMIKEEFLIESFREKYPDYIILTDKDTSEYGWRYFGRDYGLKVFSWIKDNYTPVYQAGNTPLSGRGFGVLIAKRISKERE